MSAGGRGGEAIPHRDGRRSEEAERGKRAVNEHRSRRMLWSVTVRLLGLLNSFPSQASASLSCDCSAAEYQVKKKKNTVRECLRRKENSVTIKMSVRSL